MGAGCCWVGAAGWWGVGCVRCNPRSVPCGAGRVRCMPRPMPLGAACWAAGFCWMLLGAAGCCLVLAAWWGPLGAACWVVLGAAGCCRVGVRWVGAAGWWGVGCVRCNPHSVPCGAGRMRCMPRPMPLGAACWAAGFCWVVLLACLVGCGVRALQSTLCPNVGQDACDACHVPCPWGLRAAGGAGCCWVLLGAAGCCWFCWVLLGAAECCRVVLRCGWCWMLLGAAGCCWVLLVLLGAAVSGRGHCDLELALEEVEDS